MSHSYPMGSKLDQILPIVCPFCGYKDRDLYSVAYHIEKSHTEGSPFVEQQQPESQQQQQQQPQEQQQQQQKWDSRTYTGYYYNGSYKSDDDEQPEYDGSGRGGDDSELGTYVSCPEKDCGDYVLLAHLQNHMDMHGAERLAMVDMAPGSVSGSGSGSGTNSKPTSSSASRSSSSSSTSLPPPSSSSTFSRSSFFPSFSLGSSSSSKTDSKYSRGDKHRKSHQYSNNNNNNNDYHHHRHKSEASGATETAYRSFQPSPSTSHHHHHPHHHNKKPTKSELGPYAREKQMPLYLYEQLLIGPRIIYQNRIGMDGKLFRIETPANETPDLISALAYLSERDSSVARAWLCHSGVRHICKQLPREGGFCGYRNIQMLITYVQSAYQRDRHPFTTTRVVPTIIKIQHDIEKGWDNGINVNGRMETGGILGTRKYIGTSEAETYFMVQGIRCKAFHIGKQPNIEAHENLFNFVEQWFESAGPPTAGTDERIIRTNRPPIYLQHAGHSMTIIGFERRINGSCNLLVFDPTFATSPAMHDLIGAKKKIKSSSSPWLLSLLSSSSSSSSKVKHLDSLLAAYRRGRQYLGRYNEFELLLLQ